MLVPSGCNEKGHFRVLAHGLNVLNASFQQGEVPHLWKCAEIVPIPKCQPPTLQNLRPIALTSYFAKIAESFMAKWLLEDITKHIDSNQYGNRKGLSTNHYLIQLLHQIIENAENPNAIVTSRKHSTKSTIMSLSKRCSAWA